jgi:hypothetical protein
MKITLDIDGQIYPARLSDDADYAETFAGCPACGEPNARVIGVSMPIRALPHGGHTWVRHHVLTCGEVIGSVRMDRQTLYAIAGDRKKLIRARGTVYVGDRTNEAAA